MALEMVDDPQDQQDYNDNSDNSGSRRGGRGGGGNILSFLPLLTLFRGGGGKGFFVIILLAGAGYFLMRNYSCSSVVSNAVSQFTTGGMLDPQQFKKASVYEGLADDNAKN